MSVCSHTRGLRGDPSDEALGSAPCGRTQILGLDVRSGFQGDVGVPAVLLFDEVDAEAGTSSVTDFLKNTHAAAD
jgi:hypothetical protein